MRTATRIDPSGVQSGVRAGRRGGGGLVQRTPDRRVGHLLARGYVGFTETAASEGPWTMLPTGTATVILNLAEPLAGHSDGFAAGLDECCVRVERTDGVSCVDLKLTPLGAYTLVGRPLQELSGRSADIEELFGAAGRDLVASLREETGWDARFDRVESFLLQRLADGPQPAPAIAWAWRQMVRSQGNVAIRDLADEVGWSRKHFTATFKRQLGLPPKTLARIVRFNHLVRRVRSSAEVSWGRLAAECGYYDQAHLHRDVREFAGTTPSDLLTSGTTDEVPFVQDARVAAA